MNGIHGLGAGVSMAAAGAKAVEGGNRRVFEAMLGESQAILRLETQVCYSTSSSAVRWA
jgi:hypothetical protein